MMTEATNAITAPWNVFLQLSFYQQIDARRAITKLIENLYSVPRMKSLTSGGFRSVAYALLK
jgi:hypothetical protein